VDPSLRWSATFRLWAIRLLGGLLAPSAAANLVGTPSAFLVPFWASVVALLVVVLGAAGLAAAVFSGRSTPGGLLWTVRVVLRSIVIPLLPSIVASVLSPLRCIYDGTGVAPGEPPTIGVIGFGGVFPGTSALDTSVGVSLYPLSGSSTLTLAPAAPALGEDASGALQLVVDAGPVQCWASGSPILAAAVMAAIILPTVLPAIIMAATVPFTTAPLVFDAFATPSPTSAFTTYVCICAVAVAQALLPPIRFWQHVAHIAAGSFGAWVVLRRYPFIWTSTNFLVGGALVAVAWGGIMGFVVEQVKLTGSALTNAEIVTAVGGLLLPIVAVVGSYRAALSVVARAAHPDGASADLEETVLAMKSSHYLMDKAHSSMAGGRRRRNSDHRAGRVASRASIEGSIASDGGTETADNSANVTPREGRGPSPMGSSPPRLPGARLGAMSKVMSDEEEVVFDQPWAAELAARWVMQPALEAAASQLGALVASGAVSSASASDQRGRLGGGGAGGGGGDGGAGLSGAGSTLGGPTGFRGTVGASGMPLAVGDGGDDNESVAGGETAPLAMRVGLLALTKAAGTDALNRAEAVWDTATGEHARSPWIWIAYASWLTDVAGDSARATAAVSAASRLEVGWLDRVLLYIVERRLVLSRAGATHGTGSGLDLAGYVEFTRQMRMALKSHRRVLLRIRSFWRTVQALKDRRRALLKQRAGSFARVALGVARFRRSLSKQWQGLALAVGPLAGSHHPITSHSGIPITVPESDAGVPSLTGPKAGWHHPQSSLGALLPGHAHASADGVPDLTARSRFGSVVGPAASAAAAARTRVAASSSIRLPLRRLSRQCALVDADARTAETVYRALIERYPSNTKVLRAAARFLMDVQLAQAEGERYVAEADKIETEGAEDEDERGEGGTLAGRAGELSITTAVDDATDALVVINAKGIILSANSNTRRMFGRAESELVGRNVSTLMPPTYAHQHDRHLSRYLSTGEAHVLGSVRRVEGLHRDGFTFPIEIAINRVDTPQGITFAGVIHQLKEEEACGEVTLNRRGIVVTCNRTFAKQFGWSIRAVTGKSVRRFMPRKDQKRYEATARRAGAAGQATSLAQAWKDGLSRHGMCFPIAVEASLEGEGPAALIRCRVTELASAHGVLNMNGRGIVQSCNTALLALFGFSGTSDIVGRNVTCLMPEPYATFHQSYIDRFLATGTGRIVGGGGRYVQGKRADGQPLDIFLRVSAVRDAKGKRLFAAQVELASRHLAATVAAAAARDAAAAGGSKESGDAAAAAAAQRARAVPEDGDAPSADSDPLLGRVTINDRGLIQFANRQVVIMFGYQHERDLLGKNVKMLTPPEIARQHDSFVANRVAGGEARIIGLPGRHMLAQHADGHLFPMSLAVEEERVGAKRVFHGTIRTLADLEANLIADFHGKILFANDAVGYLLGHKLTTLVGKNLKTIMPKRFADNHDGHLRRYRQTGQVRFTGRRQVVPALHADGTEVTVQAEIAKVTDARFGECLAARLTAAPMSAHEAEGLVQKRITEIDVRKAADASSSAKPAAPAAKTAAASGGQPLSARKAATAAVRSGGAKPAGSGKTPRPGSARVTSTGAAGNPMPGSVAADSYGAASDAAAVGSEHSDPEFAASWAQGGPRSPGAAGRDATSGTERDATGPAGGSGVEGGSESAGGGRSPAAGGDGSAAVGIDDDDGEEDEGGEGGTASDGGTSPSRSRLGSSLSRRRQARRAGGDSTDAAPASDAEDDAPAAAGPAGPGVVPLLDAGDEMVNPLVIFSTPSGDAPFLGPMDETVAADVAALGPLPEGRRHIAPDPELYHSETAPVVRRSAVDDNGRLNLFGAASGAVPTAGSSAAAPSAAAGASAALAAASGVSGAAGPRVDVSETGGDATGVASSQPSPQMRPVFTTPPVAEAPPPQDDGESIDAEFLMEAAGGGGGGGDDDKSEVSEGSGIGLSGPARRSHRQRMKQLRRVKRSQVIRRSVAALRFSFRTSLVVFALMLLVEFTVTLIMLADATARLTYVAGGADRAVALARMPLFARRLQVAAAANDTDAVVAARLGLHTASENVRRLGIGLEVGLGSSFTLGSPSTSALEVSSRKLTVYVFSETSQTPGYRVEQQSLFDAAAAASQAAATLSPGTYTAATTSTAAATTSSSSSSSSSSPSPSAGPTSSGRDISGALLPSHVVPSGLATDTSWRYIMDNAPTIGAALGEAAHAETTAAVDVITRFRVAVLAMAFALVAFPAAIAFGVLAPALERLEDDRQAMFRTFFLLPSAIVASLASKPVRVGQSHGKDDGDDDGSAAMPAGDDDEDDGDDESDSAEEEEAAAMEEDDEEQAAEEGEDDHSLPSTAGGDHHSRVLVDVHATASRLGGSSGSADPAKNRPGGGTPAPPPPGCCVTAAARCLLLCCCCCGVNTPRRSAAVAPSDAPAPSASSKAGRSAFWRCSRIASQPRLLFVAILVPVVVIVDATIVFLLAGHALQSVQLASVAGAQQALVEKLHVAAQELVLARSVAVNGTSVDLPPAPAAFRPPHVASLRSILADTAASLEVVENALLLGHRPEGCDTSACAWGAPWRRLGPLPSDPDAVLASAAYEVPSAASYPFSGVNASTPGGTDGLPMSSFGPADVTRSASYGALTMARQVRDLLLTRQCATPECLQPTHRLFVHGHLGLDALIRSVALSAAKLAGDDAADLAPQNGRFAMIAWVADRDLATGLAAVKEALVAEASDSASQITAARSAFFAVQLVALALSYQAIFGPIIRQVNTETSRVATFLSFLPTKLDIRKLMGVSVPSSALVAGEGESGGRA